MTETPIYSDLLDEEPDLEPIVSRFVARLPELVTTLQQAVQKTDWSHLREAAHDLKGTSGNLGFPELMRLANSIEQQALCRTSVELERLLSELDNLRLRIRSGSD